jgi:hypothetical protein
MNTRSRGSSLYPVSVGEDPGEVSMAQISSFVLILRTFALAVVGATIDDRRPQDHRNRPCSREVSR